MYPSSCGNIFNGKQQQQQFFFLLWWSLQPTGTASGFCEMGSKTPSSVGLTLADGASPTHTHPIYLSIWFSVGLKLNAQRKWPEVNSGHSNQSYQIKMTLSLSTVTRLHI